MRVDADLAALHPVIAPVAMIDQQQSLGMRHSTLNRYPHGRTAIVGGDKRIRRSAEVALRDCSLRAKPLAQGRTERNADDNPGCSRSLQIIEDRNASLDEPGRNRSSVKRNPGDSRSSGLPSVESAKPPDSP